MKELKDEFELGRVMRRLHDGEGEVSKEVWTQFLQDAIKDAYTKLYELIEIKALPVLHTELIVGRKKKEFSEAEDCMLPPPYYIWCRVMFRVDVKWITKFDVLRDFSRGHDGLFNPTFI